MTFTSYLSRSHTASPFAQRTRRELPSCGEYNPFADEELLDDAAQPSGHQ